MSIVDGEQARLFEESRIGQFGLAVREEFAAQKERLILWIPVFLAIGIGLYFALPVEPPPVFGFGALTFAVALWVLARPFPVWLLATAAFLVCLGFSAAQTRTIMVRAPVLERETGPATVTGRIVSIGTLEEGRGAQLVLDRLSIEDISPEKTPARVRIKVRQAVDFNIGDTVSVLAGLSPPSGPVEPGAFDFQQYAYFKRLGGFGFNYRAPELVAPGKPGTLAQQLEGLREIIQGKIRAAVSEPYAAIAIALMTGERTGISDEDNQAMRIAGLAHMLSISGLHLGLAASVLFAAARIAMAAIPSFALRHPIKKYAAVLALLGAIAYAMIAEFSTPSVRSLIMVGIVLFAITLDREPFSLRLVAIAATAIMLALPESLMGPSFQMSFAAVTALIFFYEVTQPWWSKWYSGARWFRRLAIYFVGACVTTVIATIATAPFALFHFQQVAAYGVLANLLGMPIMSFIIMPAIVLGYLLMPFGLEGPALWGAEMGIKWLMSVAHGVAALPSSSVNPPAMPLAALVLLVCAALFAILWKGKGRIIALVPVLFALGVIATHKQPDILVSASGKLVALRDPAGRLWVSSRRSDRFDAKIWARRHGNDPETLPAWRDNPDILCDELGCRTIWNGRRVAYSVSPAAQEEDCAWADIEISAAPLRAKPCRAAVRIGFFDLWRNGAYAVWPGGTVKSVRDVRGTRPWTAKNGR